MQTPTSNSANRFDRRSFLRLAGFGAAGALAAATLPTLRAGATPKPVPTAPPSGGSGGTGGLGGSGGWGVGANNPGTTPTWEPPTTLAPPGFGEVIARVTGMTNDYGLRQRANRYGLDIVDLTWEDTGRYEGSSVGPNISDLTLQVREPIGRNQALTHLLPVLRYPNFSDTTGDVRLDKIWVKVGNQHRLSRVVSVPLSELLSNMRAYLADPGSLPGSGNFLARRDTHVLTSAQHVFMPLPRTGKAEFTPVIYNYQSWQGNPAVLSLLVTRQGTSATIVENWSGDQSYQTWGQQLFFDNRGQRTVFTAERKSAVRSRVETGGATAQDQGALDEGSDMVMVIQVPLVHEEQVYRADDVAPSASASASGGVGVASGPNAPKKAAAQNSAASDAASESAAPASRGQRSDVEQAVIGFGADRGPFREMDGRRLVRDERFPIRVTVQFYKATSNGVVSDEDLRSMKAEIDRVYSNADYVGSLVVPDGERLRPTEWARGRTPMR
jgi:hypothetical protein